MCLVVLAWNTLPGTPLLCAGNRDEFFERPTKPLHAWENGILAGQDLVALGTWMGIHKNGRFAVVTNHREGTAVQEHPASRGALVTDFLLGQQSPQSYATQLEETASDYAGYNLLFSDLNELYHFSNVDRKAVSLSPGVYGVSNALLDTPWPKLVQAKTELANAQFTDAETFSILRNAKRPTGALPDTGIDPELEVSLSSIFVSTPTYGTRASSRLQISANHHARFREKSFDAYGEEIGDISLEVKLK